jgi:hypothetical protein
MTRVSTPLRLALGTTALLATLGLSSTAFAQTCTPLNVVDGEGTEITKIVSPIGTLVFVHTNWDTDFAVPGNINFRSFVVTLLPEEGEIYDIDVNYKYSDGTADNIYHVSGAVLTEGEPLRVSATDRTDDVPYQVNVRVGGPVAEGNRYTLSVQGCR